MLRRPTSQIKTLGALREAGYQPRSIKTEVRANLRARLAAGGPLFPGILGYDRTVIPSVVNALLAGHDFILLGLRGQAKTRILRSLVTLLDPEVPVLAGSELNDDPLAPISTWGERLVREQGDDAPVEWMAAEQRYNEKLATPDVSIADLLGDIDPIKAATRKLTFADPEVIHFGIIPRTNRGIFAINELPDLAPRIQVGLFNILEERDLQIRGFPVRIPLDLMMVFSANPEDYTNRGSIITPLKDRISSQILTHYPADVKVAADITRQEAWTERDIPNVVIPDDVRVMIEEISLAARESDLVDQSSGVSARVAISALELLASNLAGARHPGQSGLPAPLRPPHAAAGDHRQGRDGLRGGAAGGRGGGPAADRAGGQEGVRRPLPRGGQGVGQRRRGRQGALRPHHPLVRGRKRGDGLGRAAVRRVRGRDPARAGPQGAGGPPRPGPRGARARRRDDPRGAAPAPQARPRRPRQPDQLQGDGEVPAAEAAARWERGARSRGRQLSWKV